ncbi:hypothetical protein G6F31_017253 [Rhizopus arrhizus]|nr:hypothetical protein G6F31_017253 [Rhizopus arrhizus]
MGTDARKTAQREFSLAQFVGRTEEVYLERRQQGDVRQLQRVLAYPIPEPQAAQVHGQQAGGQGGQRPVQPGSGRGQVALDQQRVAPCPRQGGARRLKQQYDGQGCAVQAGRTLGTAKQGSGDAGFLRQWQHRHGGADRSGGSGEISPVVQRGKRQPQGQPEGLDGQEQPDGSRWTQKTAHKLFKKLNS